MSLRKVDDPNTVYVDSDTLMERSGPSAPEIEAGMRKSVSDRLQQLVAAEPAALGPYPLSKDYLVGTPESGESTGVSTGAPPGLTGQPPNWMTLKRRVPFTLKLPIRWNDAYGTYNSSLATGLRSDILPSLKNIFINTNGYQNVTVNRFRKGDDPNAVYVDSDILMERSGPSVPEVEAGMRKSVSDRLQQLVAAEPAALGAYPLSKEYLVGAPESDAPTGVSTGTPPGPSGQPHNLMPLKRRVPFTLKLPIRWNDAYGTSYSSLANGLRSDILPSLKNIFRNMDGYQTVTVNRFRKGDDPNTVYVESDTLMERSGPSVPEVEAGMRKSVSDRLQQLVAPEPAALGPYPLSKEFLVGAPESGSPPGPSTLPPNWVTLKRRVPFTLKLPIAWDDAYGTYTSSPATGLRSDILPSLKNIFLDMDGYRNVTVNRFRKEDDPNNVYVDSDTLMERSGPSAPEVEAGMQKSVSDRLAQFVAADPAALGAYPMSEEYSVGAPESGPPAPWITIKRDVPFTLKLPIGWKDGYGSDNSSLAQGLRGEILPSLKNIFIDVNGYQDVQVKGFRADKDDPETVYVDSTAKMERAGPSVPEVEAGMRKSVSDRLEQFVAAPAPALGAYPLSQAYLVGAPAPGPAKDWVTIERDVPFTLKLPMAWKEEYGSPDSGVAQGLKADLTPGLKDLFNGMDGYKDVKVKGFRAGEDPETVYVDSTAQMLRSGPSAPEVEGGMRKSVSDRLGDFVAGEPGKPAALGGHPVDDTFTVGDPQPVIGGPMDPAAASGPSPLSTLGEIIIALAVVGLLFLALLALATCLKRCLAARHFRRMSQVAYGEKNHGFEGSNLGLSSPYTELPNGTSALTGEPNYNMAHRGSTASQGLYIVPSSVAGYQNSRKLSQDTNGFLHTAHSSANGQARMSSGDIFGSGSQARMSSGEILGSSSQARMSSGDILGSGGQARISSGESYGYSQSRMSSGDILGSGSQARMSSGDILGSSSQARMSSGDILGSGGQARISSGESYGNNQSRMSSGNVLSLNQARMSSGEALGYNQTRMSSGDVLHSNQARILANEALGYNQARMSSGDVVDSSNARMISASNAQGYSQARKASTVMFSTTENRKSSAAHLLGNGHAMKSSSDGFSHRSNEHRSSAAHLLGNAQAIKSSGEGFVHGSNEHMSSAETDDFNQARKASTIIIDSSNRKRSLGDILEQSQAGKSSALVLGSGEQRVSSGDILGTSAARRPALYNRKQSNAVTVETREYFRSAEAPTSSDAKYLKSGQFATVKSAQYIHGGDTISGDDLRLIINEEPTVTKNSRYFESTEMVSGGDSSHSEHAFGNRESAQRGSVAYVRGGEIGESSTDVKYVLMGEQAMSEDLKYLESHGGAISGGREFDYDMDGEPIVITGIHSKEESKIGASSGKSIVSGVTGAAFCSVGTTSGERRTSSSGTEAKYVFREEHSSSGGDPKYMQSNGGVNSVGDVRYVYFDKNIPLDNSESMQKKADSHDSSYMRSYRSESRQY
ncbi:uncharacterized protein LOC127879971 isoform X1 [Dreissena polymorpha]|uniref:uncharacterized protein LOC127879971 isoform X1 n=1 Tax=Dreissena polymorpha TaxID=45954 RepID=UPI00226514FF|nr:uncharacterized protein LOC127879971 isoform X1 [Dreissena polymorpha]